MAFYGLATSFITRALDSIAYAAVNSALRRDVHVFWRVFVAMWAMRRPLNHAIVNARPPTPSLITAALILGMRYRLNMIRIAAGAVVTGVIRL